MANIAPFPNQVLVIPAHEIINDRSFSDGPDICHKNLEGKVIYYLKQIYQKSVIIHFSLVKYQLLVRNTSSVEDMILIYMDEFPVRTLN